jgi:hypothetical protein
MSAYEWIDQEMLRTVSVQSTPLLSAKTIQRETQRDKVDGHSKFVLKLLTLMVESQLYTAGALVSFYAYTIGKVPDHKGR